ncbi:conjugal transfer protein [Neisseria wadsworthii]|uniref:VirB4 family type IV secretion/conjugal transfer ATPase n=1 Tax=Neisseria wadsworthii TaxID=607711 RepID=UPI0002EDB300|nr:conjugal transfer protein [Neisseria wadsworthii]
MPRFSRHVAENIVHFEDGRLGFVLRMDGIPFEGVDDKHLIASFSELKRLFNTIGKQYGNRLGIWTTVQRQRINLNREYKFDTKFCTNFAEHYIEQFNKADYYENLFYISVILKYDTFSDGLEEINDLLEIMAKGLNSYDPHILGTYENENGIIFSEVYQFFGTLINGGIREDIPLSASAAYTVVPSASVHFGSDIMEIRNAESRKFATCYDLKEFGISKIMVLVNTLSIPCEYTLTQIFVYTNNAEMQTEINKQVNALESVQDQAVDQQDELKQGKGELAAGRMMFGDYTATLVVYGKTPKEARDNGSTVFTEFLTSGGFRFVPATLSMPATFYSQVLGYKIRPRKIPKTTTNLATVFGMHNYSQGKSWGNPIGDGSPVMPLKTLSNTLFNLSLHYSKMDVNSLGQKVAGHTLILGATGTGKTALESVILSFLTRFNPYMFVLDLDRGMEILIRALRGTYFAVEEGVPSGLNPFQLPDLPQHRMFLYGLVELCAGGADAQEKQQIKMAVDTLYEIDFNKRNFSRLMENLPPVYSPNSLRTRLSKWCRCEDGQYAWCLDNDTNAFNPEEFYRIGLDVTCILQPNYEPTGPVLSYLFYLKEMMSERVAKQGSLLVSVVAEFWHAARYDLTAGMMFKTLKTGRKMGEFMIMDSQSPEDAIACDIFPAIIQQTPTKIFLPNPEGEYEGSYQRCGLSRKEFEQLMTKPKESRTFLVKQSKQSVFCTMDLHNFDDEMAVLSGTSENVAILHEVMQECGSEEPNVWLEPFYQAVRQRISKHVPPQ